MVNPELYRKNETSEEGRHRILDDVHLGDLIECLIDQKFFKKQKDVPDRYVGYVIELSSHRIALSPTHPSNASHGFSQTLGHYQEICTHVFIDNQYIRYYRQIDSREHEAL